MGKPVPIQIDYDRELDCLIVSYSGTIVHKDIIASRDQMIDHSAYTKNLDKIIDLSQGRLELDGADVESISRHFFDAAEKMGDTRRTALVAPADADFGRARQFDIIHGSKSGMTVMSFRTFEEAADWIRS